MSVSFAFRPRILDALKGYTRARWFADMGAGITVGIVALPLAMAFAIASGLKPEAGLWTAIIGGFLVSLLGGTNVQIGGPAGRLHRHRLWHRRALRCGQPADLHHLRGPVAVCAGLAAAGQPGALCAGEHRHRFHQRHCGADCAVTGEGRAGPVHHQDAG
jgi:hypothetical protein